MTNSKTIVLNFKTFPQALGEHALRLARAAHDVAIANPHVLFIIAPATPDLHAIARAAEFNSKNFLVFAQHADALEAGQHTGSVPLEAVRAAGARGVFVNHSEKRLAHDVVSKTVERARALELKTLVCAESPRESREFARFAPWAVAVEPPELIGTGVGVSTARPELVKDALAEVKNVNSGVLFFAGAGVSNADDVRAAVRLGAEGVLLASAFVKSREPKKFLEGLVETLN
jgi:triosephosphate isomerase